MAVNTFLQLNAAHRVSFAARKSQPAAAAPVSFALPLKGGGFSSLLQGITTVTAVAALYLFSRQIPLPRRARTAVTSLLAVACVQVLSGRVFFFPSVSSSPLDLCRGSRGRAGPRSLRLRGAWPRGLATLHARSEFASGRSGHSREPFHITLSVGDAGQRCTRSCSDPVSLLGRWAWASAPCCCTSPRRWPPRTSPAPWCCSAWRSGS